MVQCTKCGENPSAVQLTEKVMNGIGKFEMREIIDKVDAALIDGFGMNMCDAGISRHEAISAYNEVNCPRQAAALCARRHGIAPQSV